MENNTQGFMSGKTGSAIRITAIMLAVFLLAETVAVFKGLPYVGREVSGMNTITVSGKGEEFKVPDIATFSFAVQEESLVVKSAQDKVNGQVKAILDYLDKNGVEKKDIKTLSYNVYPRYEYPEIRCITYPCPQGERRLAGYNVSQNVEVKVRTLADAGKLVAGIGELGATDLSGLTFTVDDEETVLRNAREKAITDAKEKAGVLARQLGVTLVRITSFSESGNPMPYYYAKADAMMGAGIGGGAPAELPSGENQFVSNVMITYEIR